MTNRLIWPAPSEEDLSSDLEALDAETRAIRMERAKFLHQEFGPPRDMVLMGPTPGYFAMVDMGLTFLNGAFLSTIMAAHVFVEQSMAAALILSGEEKAAEAGLGVIISKALDRGVISDTIADRLKDLKDIRIAYFHAHVGAKKRSFMGRFLSLRDPDLYRVVENDAKEAIRIVVDLMRFQNPKTVEELESLQTSTGEQFSFFEKVDNQS